MIIDRKYLRGVSLRDTSIPRIYLRGEAGGAPISFEGYPLELDVPNARSMKNYTIFGNTSADAKGVGDEVVNLVPSSIYDWELRTGLTQSGNIITQTIAGGSWGGAYPLRRNKKSLIILSARIVSGDRRALVYSAPNMLSFESNDWEKKGIIVDSYSGLTLQAGSISSSEPLVVEWKDVNIIPLAGTPYEDCATADEFAHRLGYADAEHLPAFPYGSSFVAPIRVGSRNLWDEEWESGTFSWATGQPIASTSRIRSKNFIPVVGGKTYYIKANDNVEILEYGADFGYIRDYGSRKNTTFQLGNNSAYIKINLLNTTAYANDVCVNLSDERNGEYSPYFAPTLYPSVLSSPLHKIGDIVDYKESNGKEWHAFGVVDLGSFDISQYDTNTPPTEASGYMMRFFIRMGGLIKSMPNYTNHIAVKGFGYAYDAGASAAKNYTIFSFADGRVFFNVPSTFCEYSKEAFKAAMAGVLLVYELATPTEVQGEPLPRLAIPKGKSIVTLDTAVEPSNITAKI